MPPAGAAAAGAREACRHDEDLLDLMFPHLAGLRVHRVEDTGPRS